MKIESDPINKPFVAFDKANFNTSFPSTIISSVMLTVNFSVSVLKVAVIVAKLSTSATSPETNSKSTVCRVFTPVC